MSSFYLYLPITVQGKARNKNQVVVLAKIQHLSHIVKVVVLAIKRTNPDQVVKRETIQVGLDLQVVVVHRGTNKVVIKVGLYQ